MRMSCHGVDKPSTEEHSDKAREALTRCAPVSEERCRHWLRYRVQVLALKVQVSDLQEQALQQKASVKLLKLHPEVTQLVVKGLEERFASLRADVSKEAR